MGTGTTGGIMNGILRKVAEARQRQWDERTSGQVLSVDLVVPEESLFICSLDELNQLNMAMLDQFTNQGWALRKEGAAYELAFHAQRRLIQELMVFHQSHRDFQPLTDGIRVHAWIKANGGVFTRSNMHTAFIVIKPLVDEIVEPPIITKQPENQSVPAGELCTFEVGATGSALLYQWLRNGEKIFGATLPRFQTCANEFSEGAAYSVKVSNAGGIVTSNWASLRMIRPN
jgi:hypothetical protein